MVSASGSGGDRPIGKSIPGEHRRKGFRLAYRFIADRLRRARIKRKAARFGHSGKWPSWLGLLGAISLGHRSTPYRKNARDIHRSHERSCVKTHVPVGVTCSEARHRGIEKVATEESGYRTCGSFRVDCWPVGSRRPNPPKTANRYKIRRYEISPLGSPDVFTDPEFVQLGVVPG